MKKGIVLILTILLLTACGSSQASQKQESESNNSASVEKVSVANEESSSSNSSSSSINDSTNMESSTAETPELTYDTNKEKGVLGITFVEITPDENEAYGTPIGLYVESILQGGAGDKSDLLEGDIITVFDNQTIQTIEDLSSSMSTHYAGDKVSMTVLRLSKDDQYEEKTIDIILTKESDVPAFSSQKANLPEEFNYKSCKDFCESHMPDGVTASFTQVEHNGIPIVIGRFHNDTEKDMYLAVEYEYGDDKGNFSTTGWGGQPLLHPGEDYYEILDSDKEYQSFVVRCKTKEVTEEIYNHYASMEIQHQKNSDGSINYTTNCADPNGCFHGIKVLYLNENHEIIDYSIIYSDTSDTEDEPIADTIESPSMEYDSYIFVWACEDY